MTLPIITERLVLRRFTVHDVADVLAFVDHPAVARATPEIEATAAAVRGYIDAQNALAPFAPGKCFDLAIVHRGEGRVMGLLTLVCDQRQQGGIGWALGVSFQGQGYATEAAAALISYGFETLALHRIHATTALRNEASWRVMERLGMRREAHLQAAEWRDGAWQDTLIYAVLLGEWNLRSG